MTRTGGGASPDVCPRAPSDTLATPLSNEWIATEWPIISQWLKIDLYRAWTYNVRKIFDPISSLPLLAKTITHSAARFLCDS